MRIQGWAGSLAAILLAGCASAPATTSSSIPAEWLQVPEAERSGMFAFTPEGHITRTVLRSELRRDQKGVQIQTSMQGSRLMLGETPLTDYFEAIDSFDVSETRGEVVLSAKRRDGNLDIGLVSLEGGDIQWVPADPADEIAVEWAPRGNKISYILRSPGGDVVRTLHIPTSFELSVPFPQATIHTLRWDAGGDHYAVGYSTPDASDRIEVLRYNGEERQIAFPPDQTLDVEVDPFAPGLTLFRPRDVKYDESLPLVVWIGEPGWNDARARLIRSARVALVVSRRRPDREMWNALAQFPWIDRSSPIVVGPAEGALERGTLITADPTVENGRYRRDGNVVRVAPAVVQSFAAGYIADLLKRTPPTNVNR